MVENKNLMERLFIVQNCMDERDDSWQRLLPALSNDRRQRVLNLRKPADRQVRALLYGVLEEFLYGGKHELSLPTESWRLSRSEHPIVAYPGHKPSISGVRNLHFNISHSGAMGVASFSCRQVGVDLQRSVVPATDIAGEFFHPREQAFLECRHGEERSRDFVRMWTMKEAYAKALGLGLHMPFREFSVIDRRDTWARVLGSCFTTHRFTIDYRLLDDGYHLAQCRRPGIRSSDIQQFWLRAYSDKRGITFSWRTV